MAIRNFKLDYASTLVRPGMWCFMRSCHVNAPRIVSIASFLTFGVKHSLEFRSLIYPCQMDFVPCFFTKSRETNYNYNYIKLVILFIKLKGKYIRRISIRKEFKCETTKYKNKNVSCLCRLHTWLIPLSYNYIMYYYITYFILYYYVISFNSFFEFEINAIV